MELQATTISKFQAVMKGFMRPNKFNIEISKAKASKVERFSMSCFQAQIPGNTIATTDKDIAFRSVAYQKIYSDVILGFYCDDKMKELHFWQDWIDSIHRKEENRWAYYEEYISEIKITPINRAGVNVAEWTLHDAYPKQIDPIQLDYGTNDAIMTINATITYRHFTVKFVELTNKKAIEEATKKGETSVEPHYTENTESDYNEKQHLYYPSHKEIRPHEGIEEFRKRMLSDGAYNFIEDPKIKERKAKRAREGGALHMVDKIQQ